MRYKTIEELIDMIERPIKTKIFDIYRKFKPEFLISQGSQHNHQAWQGGFIDHITDAMNISRLLYGVMHDKRKLSFTLSDVLVVLFLHDIEKAFPSRIIEATHTNMSRPKAKDRVRYEVLHETGVWDYLSNDQKNAIDHAEGEKDSYSNTHRIMGSLAAFVHICDLTSARIWFDRPLEDKESWGWRESGTTEDEQLWGV